MEKGLISVIIPIYNCKPYLRACVESVMASDYRNLQIILVDDGSNDGSSDLCDELALGDSRIEVIHKENEGPGPARNAGIDICNGEYVTFIDGDDTITFDMISYMYNIAVKEKCDIVQMGLCVVNEGDNYELNMSEEYVIISPEQAIHGIYTGCYVNITVKLYERHFFDDGLRFPSILHEDAYLMPRLFYKSRAVAVSEKQGYIYFQRQGSIMHRVDDLARLSALDVSEGLAELFKSWGYLQLADRARRDYFDSLLKWYKRLKKSEHKKEFKTVKSRIIRCKSKELILEHRLRRWAVMFGVLDPVDKYLKKRGM